MNMKRIHDLMQQLRLANECEAAADMDVHDAEFAVAFAQRKLNAMKERQAEMQMATEEANEALADAVAQETGAPILVIFERD